MKLVEFVDAEGETHFFDPLAVVYVSPKRANYVDGGPRIQQMFRVIYMGGAINMGGDRDEFVRLVQKRRGV